MIYDKIENAKKYRGLSKNIDTAIDFLESLDSKTLSIGKNDIDGENVYVMYAEYAPIDHSVGFGETHEKYIDIQLVLSGKEYFRACPAVEPKVTKEYNPEKDVKLFTLVDGINFPLEPGVFAMVMPGEYHGPKLSQEEPSQVKKLVIKILAK
ncbi:MAG: YhcH/YjgK/YiaL family protein [Spirochaetaceae bacterium]